jgi:hypothetical protein
VHVGIGFISRCELIGDLFPEIVGMGLRSIVTIELGGHNRRQELSLCARQRRPAAHYVDVQPHARLQYTRVEAHDVNDVPHSTSTTDRGIEMLP